MMVSFQTLDFSRSYVIFELFFQLVQCQSHRCYLLVE